MNKLAKELGIELKSFCVKTEELTKQEAVDMLDRCVELGAFGHHGVAHNSSQKYDFCNYYTLSNFNYVGITAHMNTYISNEQSPYLELLTKNEMLEYLQLHEEGGRLVPNENTTKYYEPLKLTLDEIKDNLTTYPFLNERVDTKPISDYLDYVYKLEGSKKERLDNEIKELENTLEAKKRERSDL